MKPKLAIGAKLKGVSLLGEIAQIRLELDCVYPRVPIRLDDKARVAVRDHELQKRSVCMCACEFGTRIRVYACTYIRTCGYAYVRTIGCTYVCTCLRTYHVGKSGNDLICFQYFY